MGNKREIPSIPSVGILADSRIRPAVAPAFETKRTLLYVVMGWILFVCGLLDSSARALPVDTLARVSSLGSGQLVKHELFIMLTLAPSI